MTDWSLESIEDFDGTFFDDGAGWRIVFQIHMAISLRAKFTQHPIRIGNFAKQVSGIVWLQNIDSTEIQDLPTRLRSYYSAIEDLLSSNENIRWTEASGRSPEWTIESLIADIGMGEFEPLLRPQDPRPFVWLIAALNRLTHPKLRRSLGMQNLSTLAGPFPTYYRDLGPDEIESKTFSGGDYETAWDSMVYEGGFFATDASLDFVLLWSSGPFGSRSKVTAISKTKYISLLPKKDTGEILAGVDSWFRFLKPSITQVDYVCTLFKTNYTGPNWEISVGSSEPFDTSPFPYGTFIVESDGPDLDFEGTKTIEANLLTSRTTNVPFDYYSGSIRVLLRQAWIYCDLPEIMGVGELTAPEQTMNGAAAQEE